ncbi:MAG: VOC family protein [Ignavibacteria bacterium]|nr:VOC family protein [Ignavibacteria bacterium]
MSGSITKKTSTFGWVEMGAENLDKAKQFYETVFGWTGTIAKSNSPMPYAVMNNNNGVTSGIYQLTEEMKMNKIPPHWLAYIYVNNVNNTLELAVKSGGKIIQPAFDVDRVGRMAVVSDPSGAVLAIWEADEKAMEMASGKFAPCWYELGTRDIKICEKFYADVFGWNSRKDNSMGMEYVIFSVNETMIGGMYQIPEEMKEYPSSWCIYFEVNDFERISGLAVSNGAKIIGQVMEYEKIGKFAYLQDPQGAVFSIIKSAEM